MLLGTMQEWPLRVMRLVDHAEREHGEGEIVTAWADGTQSRTNWRGVAYDARRMAQALGAIGIARGDRVATLAMNHAAHLTAWYGVIGAGAVLHTLNPRLFDEQLEFIANHAEDRVLLYDREFAPLVERMKPRWPTIEHYVCFDGDGDGDGAGNGGADPDGGAASDPSFAQWIGAHDGRFDWAEGDENEPCSLCYTSGTTGNPKGVLYSHRSTMLHALAEIQVDCFGLSSNATVLPIVPMFHANAWGLPWAAPLTGCKMVLSADYRPDRMVALFRDEGVTHTAGVPTIWAMMIAHIEATGDDLGPLEHVTIGGSAAPRSMISWFRRRGIEIGHAWGMTETSPIGTLAGPPRGWRAMTDEAQLEWTARQGRIPFGIELRTVDDDGRPLPRDGVSAGNLHVRGAWVIQRYFKAAEDAVDASGWFDTGDVAILHPDGAMQITDRAKDVIKSGGEWISSIELENHAVDFVGVAEAAVIGLPHPKWDERPLLVVVKAPGAEVCRHALRDHLAQRVARFWLPDGIEFVEMLPHTATGKLSKRMLREQFRDYRFAGTDGGLAQQRD